MMLKIDLEPLTESERLFLLQYLHKQKIDFSSTKEALR
jgi:hypothetical protein